MPYIIGVSSPLLSLLTPEQNHNKRITDSILHCMDGRAGDGGAGGRTDGHGVI